MLPSEATPLGLGDSGFKPKRWSVWKLFPYCLIYPINASWYLGSICDVLLGLGYLAVVPPLFVALCPLPSWF